METIEGEERAPGIKGAGRAGFQGAGARGGARCPGEGAWRHLFHPAAPELQPFIINSHLVSKLFS